MVKDFKTYTISPDLNDGSDLHCATVPGKSVCMSEERFRFVGQRFDERRVYKESPVIETGASIGEVAFYIVIGVAVGFVASRLLFQDQMKLGQLEPGLTLLRY